MMRRKVKGMLCAFAMGICVCGAALTVYADTVHFDITMPHDTVSKRTMKSDSEQRFYVTGTSFHQNGVLNCESIKLDNDSIRSEVKAISKASPKAKGAYLKKAPYNQNYYLATSSSTKDLHVCGSYTP